MADKTLAEIEREAIEQRIADKGGNLTHAAKSLDICLRSLQRKREAWAVLDNYAQSRQGSRQ